jgi:hypothetical protein
MISSLPVRVPSTPVALLSPDKNALQMLLRSIQGFLRKIEHSTTAPSNALALTEPPVAASPETRTIVRPRRAVD